MRWCEVVEFEVVEFEVVDVHHLIYINIHTNEGEVINIHTNEGE
jgi:hypothetical protein